MRKILFVTLHRPGRAPGQRFRFEQYVDYLHENGFQSRHAYLLSPKDDSIYYEEGHIVQKGLIVIKGALQRLREVLSADRYDIILIQREAFMLGTIFFERLYARSGAKVVFDLDDSIWLHNVSEANKKLSWLKDPGKTEKLIALADMVFAGNRYLADYARRFNREVKVIPTTIDTCIYQPNCGPRESNRLCIGWSGSLTTIQHFRCALSVLEEIQARYGDRICFKVIGDGKYRNERLGIKGIPWRMEDEIKELSSFDIGIMPLPEDDWTKGKCGLKGLQYMALEVPTIMSPVGVNKEIIRDGENGFLADSSAQWVEKLSRLIESPELRKKIGKRGRQTVIDHYSVLSQRDRYLNHFRNLVG